MLLIVGMVFAKDAPDARLQSLRSVFVSGNNQGAEQVREDLKKDAEKSKGCLTLATNQKDADGTLDIQTDGNSSMGGGMGSLGGRNWIVSGTVTLKSGDLVWSHSERFSDTPLKSGAKTAGKLVYSKLRKAACGN